MQNYEIDTANNTITYWHDRDTGQRETVSISEIVDLIFYLRSRETDLRQLLYKTAPMPIRRTMMQIGNFFTGMCEDRRKVKIRAERMQQALSDTEAIVRHNWLEARLERRRLDKGNVDVAFYDRFGNQTNVDYEITLADCPDSVIQDALRRLYMPEYWLDQHDNLDIGKQIKLP